MPWWFRSKSNYSGTKWFILIVWLNDFGFQSTDWLCALDSCITLCHTEDRLPRAQTCAITHAPFSRNLSEQKSQPFCFPWLGFENASSFLSFTFYTASVYIFLSLQSPRLNPWLFLVHFLGRISQCQPTEGQEASSGPQQSSVRTQLPTCGLSLLSSAEKLGPFCKVDHTADPWGVSLSLRWVHSRGSEICHCLRKRD